MAIQTRKQLLAELEEAGLDDDELDILQHELELDPGADDHDESDEELTSDDSDRHVVMASSSTVHGSPSPSAPQQQPACTPAVSTVPQKRKHGPKKNISPEVIDDDEDVAGSRKHDCVLTRHF